MEQAKIDKVIDNAKYLQSLLYPYGVEIYHYFIGLRVTQYKGDLKPTADLKKIMQLKTNISIALNDNAISMYRDGNQLIIEATAPEERIYCIKELLTPEYEVMTGLPLPIGRTTEGGKVHIDLAEQPHMLVAGTTGGGKSMFLQNILVGTLWHNAYTKVVILDGKGSEFKPYEKLKSVKYVTDVCDMIPTLRDLCDKMDDRYRTFAENGWTDISEAPMDRILVIIDELADIMLQSKKEAETYIVRLAQKARAAGIHLVIATQRPTRDVVTGLIKANIPCRVCFRVTSNLESRIVLDRSGAESLLDKGDMLFLAKGDMQPRRLLAPFVPKDNIDFVTNEAARMQQEYIASHQPEEPKEEEPIEEIKEEPVQEKQSFFRQTSFYQAFRAIRCMAGR